MDAEYLPEFLGTYLEDSSFMGMVCEGTDLHIQVLFALTTDHPEYAPSISGEQHCYRSGKLVLANPSAIAIKPVRGARVLRDRDGALDLGSIELHRISTGAILLVTEWFELTATVTSIDVRLSR